MQAQVNNPEIFNDYDYLHNINSSEKNQRHSKTLRWHSPLRQTFVGEYLLQPITSMRMLTKEDLALCNNCSSNLFRCYHESYTTISIRTRSGERLATLCLRKNKEYWEIDSCLGRNGENVLEETLTYMDEELNINEETMPTELYYICQEAVRLINNQQINH